MKTRKLSIRRSTLRRLSGAQMANVQGGSGPSIIFTGCLSDEPIGCDSIDPTCPGQHTCKCRGTTGEYTPATEAECVSQEGYCQSQPC